MVQGILGIFFILFGAYYVFFNRRASINVERAGRNVPWWSWGSKLSAEGYAGKIYVVGLFFIAVGILMIVGLLVK